VLLGVVFLRERLRVGQWLPIGLAAVGVLYLTVVHGSLPWIALTLAFSFGIYGLVKKTAPLGSIHGLALETGVLVLPAFLFLLYVEMIGQGQFLHDGSVSDLLLVGTGLVTSIPLLMFASAARRIPLSVIGILQYIAPTLQFLLGVFVYKEPFDPTQLVGYALVWMALIIFAVEGLRSYRAQPVVAVAE
jgi:chloramphenicol-sensitive protein RarD